MIDEITKSGAIAGAEALPAAASQAAIDGGAAAELFCPGDRVAFFGDSITYASNFIEFLRGFAMMEDGEKETFFFNLGIPGDTCTLGAARINRELLPLKLDVVFILFGMNDLQGWRFAGDQDLQREAIDLAQSCFEKNLASMVQVLLDRGHRVVLLTPTPYDQYSVLAESLWTDYNEKGLARAADFIRHFAAERHLPCIDLFAPMTEYLKAHPGETLCGKDRVHPEEPGHFMIARLIWNASKTKELSEEAVAAFVGRTNDFRLGKIVERSKGLTDKASCLREAAWMQEIVVRNSGILGVASSEDAALDRELNARKETAGYGKYQNMVCRYRENRDMLICMTEDFYKECSELFREQGKKTT